jgi:hypothetical protein
MACHSRNKKIGSLSLLKQELVEESAGTAGIKQT